MHRHSDGKSLDETDRKILRLLRSNCRLTTQEIADQVGLSATPCWSRIKRMEESGVITGYVALLDPELVGRPDTVIVEVNIEQHDDDKIEAFSKYLLGMPEVTDAYLTTGEYDYVIIAAVDGTEGYEQFLRKKLLKFGGIRHTRSTFCLRRLKREPSPSV
ncbi:Lrp/AsnC family transcriptional regulator [Asticcacaulis sp. YBE204]|uniref:Lrp/AsnC family transcriptional regulator n=1 Tax=Asticcacaulis sp. YBE204 TaxID=1282363 RepID=UPI0003C3DB1E|nr:Lrp/AsnC family transcriptional regulator [Asticcacaulis sp. YBE204]ESQ79515.1 AsnC family transcriptional regulator [Asticcacaulis sp. YBE204]